VIAYTKDIGIASQFNSNKYTTMKLLLFLLLFPAFVQSVNIDAKAWAIADGAGNVIEEQNIQNVQPIASITKLMTVMVVLDSNESLKEPSKLRKFRGLALTRQQLIDLAIIRSDNDAANMLCKMYHRGYTSCIADMNHKAKVLGMDNTQFHDSTGLDNRNVSNAADLLKLLMAAEKYPEIVHASNQSVGELLKPAKKRILKWKYTNTNPLVSKYNVIVSKTGYVRLSGGCLVMSTYIKGQKRLFVVLNSRTTRTRIHDMETLIIDTITKI
jgi:D-alanyl-D-alanine endopeptidase (penicillin-binding protein 7)